MAENKEPNENSEIPEEKDVPSGIVKTEIEDTGSISRLEEEPIVAETPEEPSAPVVAALPPKTNKFKRFLGTKKGKVITTLVILLAVLGVLYAVPATRYGILGNFVKKDVTAVIKDVTTNKPITEATVVLGAISAKTDNNGKVVLGDVPVGEYTLKITKKFYKEAALTYTVPVFGAPDSANLSLSATGRQVTVVVKDKITQSLLAKATITVQGTSAITDDKGVASIVLPADKKTLTGTVTAEGYNQSDVEIKVTDQADANTVTLTPSGSIYFLSKKTGKLNVMKSYLDGSNASVVVEGTGNEIDNTTVLLAARDWKYMALSAKRDNNKVGQLYLVDGKSGNLTTIDEGDATFQLVGWSGHRFIYQVNRNNKKSWDDKQQSLKSFDAETGKLTTLDETAGMGNATYDYQNETIQNLYILNNKIVYAKVWNQGGSIPSDKKSAIMAVNPDGSGKQRVKEFGMQRYLNIEAKLYAPQEVYFKVSVDGATSSYYEYEKTGIKSVSNTDDKFYNTFYPTYLISPSDQKTFWYEPRDGKNILLVGNADGKDFTTLADKSDYIAYGWYSDKYVLLSKNDSELYIAPSNKSSEPLKITNYHKPAIKYPGYGYGYGGQ